MLTAAEILRAGAVRRETVSIEGVGEILVRELMVGERAQVIRMTEENPAGLPALLLRLCVIAEDGTPLFAEVDAGDIDKLRPGFADQIAHAVMKLSGMRHGAVPEKKA